MMLRMNWTLSTILLAGSFGVIMPQANAQQSYHATFTLPVQARFGGVVLQPGEYTISTHEVPSGTNTVRITGDRGTATMIAAAVELEPESGHARLTLANVNGTYAVKRLDAGSVGKAFDFRIPKALPVTERAGTVLAGMIEIALK